MDDETIIGTHHKRKAPLSSAEGKHPSKKGILFRPWFAIVAAIAVVGSIFALPSVRNRLFFDKNYIRIDYDSFKAMVREEEDLLAEEYRSLSGAHLAALASDGYDKASFYICREKNPSPFVLPQLYFVAELKKADVRTEIIFNILHVPPVRKGVPARFGGIPKEKSVQIGDTLVAYAAAKKRIECAFIDQTGSYLIHCHSGNAEDLVAVLEDLLDRSIEKDTFS